MPQTTAVSSTDYSCEPSSTQCCRAPGEENKVLRKIRMYTFFLGFCIFDFARYTWAETTTAQKKYVKFVWLESVITWSRGPMDTYRLRNGRTSIGCLV